jgi:hypothetical protein
VEENELWKAVDLTPEELALKEGAKHAVGPSAAAF